MLKINNIVKNTLFSTKYFSRKISIFNNTFEKKEIRRIIQNFVKDEVEPQANKFNKLEKFNIDLYKNFSNLGFLGLTVDPKYGGIGMDATSSVIVHEELSKSDPAFCLSYLAHSILFVNNLHINGSEYLKTKYLPDACEGNIICGMGMSESEAGTDVLNLKTKAIKNKNDDFILNGSKMWITNGTVDGKTTGDAFIIYAKTGNNRNDISAFVVDKNMHGFNCGQIIKDKCGMRASMTCELIFNDVIVPKENLIGYENDALTCMMKNLEIERVCLAAMSIGIANRCIETMLEYSNTRKTFEKLINTHGQVQSLIANSYSDYMAGKHYLYNISNNLDLYNSSNALESDSIKLFCGKICKNIADNSIQVLGGNGYIGEYSIERLWRDSKLLEIGGGTNEAHQKNIIRELSRNI